MRLGPRFYKPHINPTGLDYFGGDRREPVALLDLPDNIVIQVVEQDDLPEWAGYLWPGVSTKASSRD